MYIGDLDMLIFKESPTLLDYHLDRCEQLNLPYSNHVRGRQSGMRDGEHRFVGLHFSTSRWFAETAQIRSKYALNLIKSNLRKHMVSNECLLYRIAEESIGLPPFDDFPIYEYHGIH